MKRFINEKSRMFSLPFGEGWGGAFLLLILLLFCMPSAFAGTGTGSKDDPYTGEWDASLLVPKLRAGNHLAYDCVIKNSRIYVYDDKDNNKQVIQNWASWAVGSTTTNNSLYNGYLQFYTPEERQKHTFIITNAELRDGKSNITGHFSGCYDFRGDGSKEHPYTGNWEASELTPLLEKGNHLAYDCVMNNGKINVYDDKANNKRVVPNWGDWAVGSTFTAAANEATYKDYCQLYNPTDRQKHTFIITNAELRDGKSNITGHFSGCYDLRGDGTKEHPYTGNWDAKDLAPKLGIGKYLAFDCVISNGIISVYDSRLNEGIANTLSQWAPGNVIGDAQLGGRYTQYGKDNSLEKRKKQSFIITYVDAYGDDIDMEGYFSGFYSTPDANDGFVYVATTEQLWKAIKANAHAKVRLTQDFSLSDIDKDYETYCDTFYGTIDGDGHTIKGDPQVDVRARTYMFTNSDGATFKNLTFKGIRVNNNNDPNQAIITSKAKNNCVFENITFDNVHTWSNKDNAGSAAGWAQNCTFTNITVKNSDFTTDATQAGGVVGHAIGCTFTNIKVENCESTADNEKAGGVVGRADGCTFNNVDIHGCYIVSYDQFGGGVAGLSTQTHYTNCVTDDQTCIFVDGGFLDAAYGYAGGIVGHSEEDDFHNCINSALVACEDEAAGGIAGLTYNSGIIEGCLNTGMIIYISESEINSFYNDYKNRVDMVCVTKTYNGKDYVIRQKNRTPGDGLFYGGIVGGMRQNGHEEVAKGVKISKCANIGSVIVKACVKMGVDAEEIPFCAEYSCGGITGSIEFNGTISDCLSDFYSIEGSEVKEFCGFTIREYDKTTTTKFENCLNVKTASESNLRSGKICASLGAAWEQNIGNDPYPTPTCNKGEYRVYHTRIVNNEYGTVCLPFPVKSDDNISYYRLSKKVEDGQDIKLMFKYVEDEIQAGTPLLFRLAEAINAKTDNPVVICINPAGNDIVNTPLGNTGGYWEMWGTFEQTVFEGDLAKSIYYVSDGEITNTEKATIAPFQAYIYGPKINTIPNSNIKIAFDNTATSIISLPTGEGRGEASYTLMGTKAPAGYKGIVIKNGRKTVNN